MSTPRILCTALRWRVWLLFKVWPYSAYRFLIVHPARTFVILIPLTAVGLAIAFFVVDKHTSISVQNVQDIRDLALIFGGAVAIVFAVWRTWTSERQMASDHRRSMNDRYMEGVSMLFKNSQHKRIAGIRVLERLTEESSYLNHIQIVKSLSEFVHRMSLATESSSGQDEMVHSDVEAAALAVGRSRNHRAERDVNYIPSLKASKLSQAQLAHCDFSGMDLAGADLSEADLRDAIVADSNLDATIVTGADISGALFSDRGQKPAKSLTQEQLDSARADAEYPPMLDGVKDAETGKQLVWRGEASEQS